MTAFEAKKDGKVVQICVETVTVEAPDGSKITLPCGGELPHTVHAPAVTGKTGQGEEVRVSLNWITKECEKAELKEESAPEFPKCEGCPEPKVLIVETGEYVCRNPMCAKAVLPEFEQPALQATSEPKPEKPARLFERKPRWPKPADPLKEPKKCPDCTRHELMWFTFRKGEKEKSWACPDKGCKNFAPMKFEEWSE